MAASDAATALVLFAHGSRDPQWAAPFHAIREQVSRLRPATAIELAFLELMQPSLEAAVDQLVAAGHARIVIAPLFMAQGAHMKRDLARILTTLTERHPRLDIELLPAIGEAAPVMDAVGAWLADHV